MVRVAYSLHLRQEPQPLLCERHRKAIAALHPWDNRQLRAACSAQSMCQVLQARMRKDVPYRNIYLEPLAHSRHCTHGQQRVTAQLEEVVVTADPIELQQLTPDIRQLRLHFP